jgi:tRNA-dihydrouridine synthase
VRRGWGDYTATVQCMSGSSKKFWSLLKRPIFVQAPMIGVTDPAYRSVISKFGAPDVSWTEFVSAAGLCRENRRSHLLPMLGRVSGEKYCVAQLFGRDPMEFKAAAQLCKGLGFDGIAQGSGAALINDFALAQRIIRAAKEGADPLPVSVKSRVGYNKIIVGEWMSALCDVEPAAITMHLRTRSEMSSGGEGVGVLN